MFYEKEYSDSDVGKKDIQIAMFYKKEYSDCYVL